MRLYCIRKTEILEVWCDDDYRIQCIGRIVVDNPGSPLAVSSLLDQMEQIIGEISYQYLEEGPDDPLPVDKDAVEKAVEKLRLAHSELSAVCRQTEDALAAVEEVMDLLPVVEGE